MVDYDKDYETWKNTVMRKNFPYEWALLSGDLKSHLRALAPDYVARKDTKQTYSIGVEWMSQLFRYDNTLMHPLDFDKPPLKKRT